MRARWLLNLLLLLVVAVLATLAYLRPGLDEAASAKTLSQLSPEQVQRVQIERLERDTITMVRSANGWQLTTPVNLPANSFRIDSLLQLRRAVAHSSFPVVEVALPQYGLSPPEVWLSLDDERYAFGGIEPLNGYRYVMVGGAVHLLSDRIQNYLLMSPYDFVSLQLLPREGSLQEVRFDSHIVNDELALSAWGEAQARRVSPYSEPVNDAQQLLFILADGEPLKADILLREPEFVLGVAGRGVRYHFTEETGERLMQLMAGDDA